MSDSVDLWLEDLHRGKIGLTVRLRECLAAATSPFQRLAVYDTHALGRIMVVGGEISFSESDEATYSELLVHPGLAAHPDPKRVLILGGGDGGAARECLRDPRVQRVVVVEIDREVVELSSRFFPTAGNALRDPRVSLVIDDAHRWLKASEERFDLVITDACSLLNPASDAFHEDPFHQAVFGRLAPNGIMVSPLGSPLLDPHGCREVLDAVRQVGDPRVYLMAVPTRPGGLWAIACAGAADPLAVPASRPWHDGLRCWHPSLQPALFTLPRHIVKALGI